MKRIQSRITLTYVLLTLVVVVALGVISSVSMESYFQDRLVADLDSRLAMIKAKLLQQNTRTPEQTDRLVKDLGRAAQTRVTLIDSSGGIAADSEIPFENLSLMENHRNRPEVQRALRLGSGSDTRMSSTMGREFLYAAHRIPGNMIHPTNTGVYVLRLSVHVDDVRSVVRDIRMKIFLAGLVVLVLVAVTSVLLSRRVAQPIVTMAGHVEQIRSGRLDVRVPVQTDDEIGRLAIAVNEMVQRLEEDIVRLKKLERVRSEFLGNVSHELRTPIFSLQGFLETLLEGAVDDPKVNRMFLTKAHDHAERLNTLLAELISISQIESGEMRMSFRYFPLEDFLVGIVRDFEPAANHHGITLSTKLSECQNMDALGDKERLAVVVSNLLENAIKYNRPGGSVTVSCEAQPSSILIVVSDTGVGIAPEHHGRIFERFYRVDKDRSRAVGGTGLGLAIAKHIIEAHGSTLEVSSEPEKGSRFGFSLRV